MMAQTTLDNYGECEGANSQNVDTESTTRTTSMISNSPPNTTPPPDVVSLGSSSFRFTSNNLGRALSLSEAQDLALATVRALPVGYRFTLLSLFPDLKVRGNPRRRAGMLLPLRRQGLIRAVGMSKKGQDRRNGGFATLWEVVKNE